MAMREIWFVDGYNILGAEENKEGLSIDHARDRLADELAMDRSTLRRIFQSKMCMTPSDYLAKLRIQHALSLLEQTRLPLAEIADRCGFSDVSYFCRVIRRAVGVSPGSFRAH